jgi:hypothetical protein
MVNLFKYAGSEFVYKCVPLIISAEKRKLSSDNPQSLEAKRKIMISVPSV